MASGRVAPSGVRRSVGGALGWVEDHELVRLILVGLVVVALLVGFVFARAVAPDESSRPRAMASPSLAAPPVVEPEPLAPEPIEPSPTAEYENVFGGFAFDYPTGWNLIESGPRAFLESPDGRLVLGFGRARGSTLAAGSDSTIEAIVEGWRDHELTGSTRERIAGSPSLLVGGTIAEGERAMRFLAITVRAGPHNYAISILAPRGADPMGVLPRIEEIVASFEVLGSADPTSA